MKNIYLSLFCCSLAACSVEHMVTATPLVETGIPIHIQTTTAQLGGDVYNDAGSPIEESGVVLSAANAIPTLNDTKVAMSNGETEFVGAVSNLQPQTTYYYRAYGTNATNTGYGEVATFTTWPAKCTNTQPNVINTGTQNLTIANVVKRINTVDIFLQGNVMYYNQPVNNQVITLQFFEKNAKPPVTGVYSTIDQYNTNSLYSDFQVKVLVSTIGGQGQGTLAANGQQVYVENNNGTVTFTFCGTTAGSHILNGEFTHVQ